MFPNETFGCSQSGKTPIAGAPARRDARAMTDDFPILAAVAANPTHPYALLEHLSAAGLPVTRSTLYRRVEALVAQGWLAADDIRGETGHYRRALSLTRRGRERLRTETREALTSAPLESPVFAFAVAAAGADGTENLAAVLKPRMALAARALTGEERELRDAAGAPALGRSRRIAHLQADIAWLQGLLGQRVVGGQERGIASRASGL